jgi:GNAT superfamily N-acetyltransferase
MIYSKFLRSLKYGNDWFRLIDNEVYFDVYEKFIEKLVEKDSAIIYLATLSDDEDVVLGWALMEPGILHYVFVNPEQRYQGIAKALVGGKYHTITHLTNTGAKIFAKNKDIKFNPFYN